MPRRPRSEFDGAIHHVMNRGVDHQSIFFGDTDRIEFGRLLAECHEEFGLETIAYCLMGNHYHLVVRTPAANLSLAMKHLAATYVRHTNDRIGRDGPLFRGRFVSLPVSTPAYLCDVVRYVHRNPLDLAGVEHPARYRWSSYRAYLGFRRSPAFLRTDLVLSMFGGDLPAFQRFTEAVRPQHGNTEVSPETILGAIRRELEVERLSRPTQQPPRERVILAALLDAAPTAWQQPIDELLGFDSDSARRSALSRARRRAVRDPRLNDLLGRLFAA